MSFRFFFVFFVIHPIIGILNHPQIWETNPWFWPWHISLGRQNNSINWPSTIAMTDPWCWYANIKGVYWWDPWSTIYGSTMDPMGLLKTAVNCIQNSSRFSIFPKKSSILRPPSIAPLRLHTWPFANVTRHGTWHGMLIWKRARHKKKRDCDSEFAVAGGLLGTQQPGQCEAKAW